jgi:hypothetical protein
MAPTNQPVLFAYQMPLANQIGKPAFVPLPLREQVINRDSNTVPDSCWGCFAEKELNPLMHRQHGVATVSPYVPSENTAAWGETTTRATSLLSHIPKDQDFSELLLPNQLEDNLAFSTMYLSEAEFLYMRYRGHN